MCHRGLTGPPAVTLTNYTGKLIYSEWETHNPSIRGICPLQNKRFPVTGWWRNHVQESTFDGVFVFSFTLLHFYLGAFAIRLLLVSPLLSSSNIVLLIGSASVCRTTGSIFTEGDHKILYFRSPFAPPRSTKEIWKTKTKGNNDNQIPFISFYVLTFYFTLQRLCGDYWKSDRERMGVIIIIKYIHTTSSMTLIQRYRCSRYKIR